MGNKTVNIFWTGGWDSTFRLLQLLLVEKKIVQPHFVVRAQASVGKEINTMIDIRRELFRSYPQTRSLLQPTRYSDIDGVSEFDPISSSLEDLSRRYEIAQQYDFCSRYCREHNIYDMELCIEKDSNPQLFLSPYIDSDSWTDSISTDNDGSLMCEIFKYYRFPLIKMTKTDMEKYSYERGWNEIMKMTWFCATPYNEKPCGFCGPCTYTIEEGLSWRIPFIRRLFSIIHMPLRRFYRNKIK